MPLDERDAIATGARDDGYGRIVIRVGERTGETRSTSRREIVTRVFEVAGTELPSFAQAPYPGYPAAWAPGRVRIVQVVTYVVLPGIVLLAGALVTRRRRSTKERRPPAKGPT
jgi:hypothetical protein